MRTLLAVMISLACVMPLVACDQDRAPSKVEEAPREDRVAQDTSQLEIGVRLAVANKQIDELERKVAELEATPQRLNLDLLSQRVTELEVKAASASSSELNQAPVKGLRSVIKSVKEPQSLDGNTPKKAPRTSKLNLPDLEKRTRLATPAEIKAFQAGK